MDRRTFLAGTVAVPAVGAAVNVLTGEHARAAAPGYVVNRAPLRPDAFIRHLDLTAFVRTDLVDHSCLPWAEVRYHWRHFDVAAGWQTSFGGSTSDFGDTVSRRVWQAVLDYYL